jgi:hypothetical protein
MSEVIEKKSGITFSCDKSVKNQTTIVAHTDDKELPIILAFLVWKKDTAWWIGVTDITHGKPIFDAVCYRGRSFAERIARFAIRGCFSCLGKRHRMTANKQKKAEVQHD